MKEGEVIESGMLTRQIEKAQRKVESHNFDIRKQLLLFDDVANDQRKVVYQQRTEIMGTEDLSRRDPRASCEEAVGDAPRPVHAQAGGARRTGTSRALAEALQRTSTPASTRRPGSQAEPELEEQALRDARGAARCSRPTTPKVARIGGAGRSCVTSRSEVMLQMLDQHWREHLAAHGLPAPGHPPAWLCAEGLPLRVQARGLRAVRRHARAASSSRRPRSWRWSRSAPRRRSSARRQERRERLMRALQAQHAEARLGARRPEQAAAPAGGARRAAVRPSGAAAAAPPLPSVPEAVGTFVRDERKVGPQRAVSVRLGQEVQALPRRALERRVAPRVRILVVAAALYDATAAGADRAAAAGQAHGRPLGVPRRQGRRRREPSGTALGRELAEELGIEVQRGRAAACA